MEINNNNNNNNMNNSMKFAETTKGLLFYKSLGFTGFIACVGVVLLAFCLLSGNNLYAQTESAAAADSMRNGTNMSISLSKKNSEEADAIDEGEIQRYKTFAPQFMELYDARANADEEYFKRFTETLEKVKDELENSAYIVLKQTQTNVDRQYALRGVSFYKADLQAWRDYYRSARDNLSFFYYIEKSEKFLQQTEEFFMSREKAFAIVASEEELSKAVYEMKSLKGIVLLYRGSERHLKEAVYSFEYLLGNNPLKKEYVQNNEERMSVYEYLAGINNRIFDLSKSDYLLSLPYIRQKLYYLWKLTEVANAGNEDLRNLKLQDLSDRYYSIMNIRGIHYKDLYKPYLIKTLEKFQDSNTLDVSELSSSSSDVQQVSGDESNEE